MSEMSEHDRKMAAIVSRAMRASDGRCPDDGQSLEWHQHVGGTHYDGRPRTNGEFIDCDFAEREAGR